MLSEQMKAGDIVTVAGFYEQLPNPDRRWWQFWKPRTVNGDLRKFTLVRPETRHDH